MKMGLYSLKDELKGFEAPMMMMNDDEAIRTLKILANTPDNLVCLSAEDYSVYKIGSFDTECGKLEIEDQIKLVARAKGLKE